MSEQPTSGDAEASKTTDFVIPDISSGAEKELTSADIKALLAAQSEAAFYATETWSKVRHEHLDRRVRFVMKPALFLFVIGLNVWWDLNVRKMVWESGRSGSNYHLDNPVLIALLTTSIANFLALLIIVAKHLFPNSDKPIPVDNKDTN